ncbi:MAG: hypothetical protein QM662_18685, partial [Gordonia sp. (in: high G+C Gram-positive bacteria)]
TAAIGTVSGTVRFADFSDPARPRVVGSIAAQPVLNETVDYSERSHLAVTGATDLHRLTVIDAADLTAPRVVATVALDGGIWWATLSPDGRAVAVATTTGAVHLIDLSNPAAPRRYPDPITFEGASLAVRFNEAGDRLVATSEERRVVVADISDPAHPHRIAALAGPAGQLYSAAFSPDARRVIAGGSNAEIWVWDLADPDEPLIVLRSFPGRVYDVRFLAADRIIAAGLGGVVQQWGIGADALVASVCERPGDQITADEWALYVQGLSYRPPCG